jgi:acetyl-CoA acetyltransferase
VSETTEIVLVDAARTPHGTVLGLLADRSAVDLGTVALDGRLDRSGIAVDDVDHSEGNEAFAAQTVYVRDRLDLPADRSNPSGGAIAFGHPIGASGGDARHLVAVRDGTREHTNGWSACPLAVAVQSRRCSNADGFPTRGIIGVRSPG